jgi:hypothetical protein
MNRLIALALSKGWREGVLKGSRPWMVAGGLALAVRVFQRAAAREETVVYREELPPGETLTIAHEPPS